MPGISHITIGSNDLVKSKAFYDAAFGPLGFSAKMATDDRIMYGADGAPMVIVRTPLNGEPATFGNGGTIGFSAASRSDVDAFYAAGLANGGSCEGAPGKRAFHPDAYGAYLRDPDGNKMCAFSYAPD